jgi:hypothetical protein
MQGSFTDHLAVPAVNPCTEGLFEHRQATDVQCEGNDVSPYKIRAIPAW